MGYPMRYRNTKEIWDEIREVCPQFYGATYEKMEGLGYAQWPIPDVDGEGTPDLYLGGTFNTSDGRALLLSHRWVAPTEEPDDGYPLVLCTVREVGHYSCRSMTGNCRALAQLADEPGYVHINPIDAESRGIRDEELVWVYSRRGKVITRASIDERINAGAVYMTYQWWIGKCNDLTMHVTDPLSGTPEDKFSSCDVASIGDQVWAEQHMEMLYNELKARLAAEAAHQDEPLPSYAEIQ